MPTLNARIWAKLMEDPEFVGQPPAVIEASRPFIEHLPELLEDVMETKADLSLLMEAKLRWIRYCLESGYIQAAVEAYPEEALGGFFDRADLIEMFDGMLGMALELAESLTGDNLVDTLEIFGVTEEQVIGNLGLNPTLADLYEGAGFTMRQLLEEQPQIIIVNKSN